jgi:hypothetical protein
VLAGGILSRNSGIAHSAAMPDCCIPFAPLPKTSAALPSKAEVMIFTGASGDVKSV